MTDFGAGFLSGVGATALSIAAYAWHVISDAANDGARKGGAK